MPEVFCDGVDQDCDGSDCCANDADGDGAPCSADCDDHDPKTYSGAPVLGGCYFKDANCDGTLDGTCRFRRRCAPLLLVLGGLGFYNACGGTTEGASRGPLSAADSGPDSSSSAGGRAVGGTGGFGGTGGAQSSGGTSAGSGGNATGGGSGAPGLSGPRMCAFR